MSSDQDFGPKSGTTFDFTLAFDQSILNILPSSILVLVAPLFIRYYRSQAQVILSSGLLWGKLGLVAILAGADLSVLVLWCVAPSRRSSLGIASSAVSFVSSVCLAGCLFTEHRHSLRSSAILSICLTSGIVFDAATARSYFLRSGCDDLGAVTVLAAACKLAVMILEEIPKNKFAKMPNKETSSEKDSPGKEATSGFWNRTLYLWLNETFHAGFKQILCIDQLDKLGPEFSSETLSEAFKTVWPGAKKQSKYALAITCLRILRLPALSIVPPRLCFTFFMFIQPFFLRTVVSALQNGAPMPNKWGLVAAGGLIYFGVASSQSLYQHLTYRLITLVRGVLVGAILGKSLALSYHGTVRDTVVTHMTTDIDTIAIGFRMLHETWINVIEIVLGIYLLYTIVGEAAFLVLLSTLISIWSAWYLAKHFPPAKAAWNESIKLRVARTSAVLSQIKAIKMSGMESIVAEQLRELRAEEIRYSSKTRLLGAIYPVIAMVCKVFTPAIIIAGALFLTTFSGKLTTNGAFSTLAFVTIISRPLSNIMEAAPVVRSSLFSFSRIQAFLLLEEVHTDKVVENSLVESAECAMESPNEKGVQWKEHNTEISGVEPHAVKYAARFFEASVAIQQKPETVILKDLTLDIGEGDFVIVTGPTGCGKSTFLRSLLNETEIVKGTVAVKSCSKAYCDQTPWIMNNSIKDNITCFSAADQTLYDMALDTCLLRRDLSRFPKGDLTEAGSNGLSLSGGQKHRVAAARAIFARKSISIFDDIFSALDAHTAAEMFQLLFGTEGLMRRPNSTVILATNMPQFSEAADRVLFIDAHGNCKVQTDVRDPEFQKEVQDLLSLNDNLAHELRQQDTGDDGHVPDAVRSGEDDDAVEDETDRRRGNFKLYSYFIKSMGVFRSLVWLAFTILNAVAEKFPDIFLTIWLNHAPEDSIYFAGYVLVSFSAVIFTIACFGFWFAWVVPASLKNIHDDLLDTIMRAKLSFLTKTDHGILLNFISHDMTLVSQIMPLIFLRAVYFTFYTTAVIAVVLSGVRYAGAIVPLLLAVLYIVQHVYLRTSRQVRLLGLESTAPLYTLVTESMSGLLHIRAFGWERETFVQGLSLLDTSQKPYYHMYAIQRWLTMVMDLIVVVIAITMLPIAFSIEVSATATSIALSLVSLIQLSEVLNYFVINWTLLETSLGALARLYRLFQKTPREGKPSGDVDPSWPSQGRVVINDFSAKYNSSDSGASVLSGISIDIAPAERVGVVGRTGSGKSSMLLGILNFLDYTGSITIDDVEISAIPPELLRWRIPTISQDLLDLDETVRFTVCPWTNSLSKEEYEAFEASTIDLLQKLGLWAIIEAKDGLDTKVATLGLSQGQQQLLSIARGIMRQQITGTKVVLMDEPTGMLDLATDKVVQRLFDERLRGCTIITVAHRPQSIIRCHTIYKLSDGRVVSRSERRQLVDEGQKIALRGKSRPNAGRNRKGAAGRKRYVPGGTKMQKSLKARR